MSPESQHTTEGANRPTEEPPPSALTVTVSEAAALLGIGRDLAYRAAATGELPTVRIGRRLLVPRHQLAQMLRGARDPNRDLEGEDA